MTVQKIETHGAYLNDASLKRRMLAEMTRHTKADQLVKGTYGQMNGKWRGCAIGCALHSLNRIERCEDLTLHTGQHERFPAELGIPLELAYLVDHFFENLPLAESQKWPRAVLAAIPVGADLSGIVPAILQWSILDAMYGWMAYAKTPAQRALVEKFAEMSARDWRGPELPYQEWADLTAELDAGLPEWARARAWAWARARARARAWAWAGAWAWAWAWAWAGAWARPGYEKWYVAASQEVLRLLKAQGVK